MNWKPSKWGAAALSLFAPPLGMLYVNRAWLAALYFGVFVAIAVIEFWSTGMGHETPLPYIYAIVAVAHTYRIAAKSPEMVSRPWVSRWYGLLAIALASFFALALFRAFAFEPFHLPSQAMYPSMPSGSHIVVQKHGYGNYASYRIPFYHGPIIAPLERGDVLVFEYPPFPSTTEIKRVVGLPGDQVEYKSKRLYVNGVPVLTKPIGSQGQLEIEQESNYQIANDRNAPPHDFAAKVEPEHLFVLGDNRDHSHDSRYWGQVSYGHVIGKVVLVLSDPKAQPIVPGDAAR